MPLAHSSNQNHGTLPLVNRNNTIMSSLRSSFNTSASSAGSKSNSNSVMTADGRTGGRRTRPSLRSLRNVDVLRNSTPPVIVGESGRAESTASLSGGQLNKLSEGRVKPTVGRSNSVIEKQTNSAVDQTRDKRISTRRCSTGAASKHSNSLRFHRVDVEWEPGQLEDVDVGGGRLAAIGGGATEDNISGEVESLQMEIMDLRPTNNHALLAASFVSIADEENAREMFRTQLGMSEREEDDAGHPASHWEQVGEYQHAVGDRMMMNPMNRRGSWNSCHSMSNLRSDLDDSLSGSIISTMSMSQHSANRTYRSGCSVTSSKESEETLRKNAYFRRYVKPILVIVTLATITAVVIYILLDDGFDGIQNFGVESRNVIHNWLHEEESGGAARSGAGGGHKGVGGKKAGGGRAEMELTENFQPEGTVESTEGIGGDGRRLNKNRGDQGLQQARQQIEELYRLSGKNSVIANVGIGNF